MTDNDIIRGIRENSSEAWRELYHSAVEGIREKIEPMLKKVKHLTFDDLFKDACITLMEDVQKGKVKEGPGTNLSGYLYTICWRMALRQNDRESRPKEPVKAVVSMRNGAVIVEEPNQEMEEEDPVTAQQEEEEAFAFLDKVLKSIPEDCQKLLRWFYWDKMPMKDIAPAMGLKNENVAKTKKNRCMDKFKEIAKAMLADDEKAEEAVRRTVERDALRDLLDDLRKEESGDLAMAALKNKDKGKK